MIETSLPSSLDITIPQVSNQLSAGHRLGKTHFPAWLRKPIHGRGKKNFVDGCIIQDELHTVCAEAKCPNRNDCFSKGTATFLLMGDVCTRNCLFCSVKHGEPFMLNNEEPSRVSHAAEKLGLSFVVLTSVTRDDLEDGGAIHFAETVTALKETIPDVKVEVLVPDFKGSERALRTVLSAKPDIFNHNIETVSSIFTHIRPEADYELSLRILRYVTDSERNIPVKSGFMVGLGETEDGVISLLQDLHKSGVSIVTIGQYLQPSEKQVAVEEFITPDTFSNYRAIAEEIGFEKVYAAPFVRSSYNAAEVFKK